MPDSAGLSVNLSLVVSRCVQLERGPCHTRWHRLNLDFVSTEVDTGQVSAYAAATGLLA